MTYAEICYEVESQKHDYEVESQKQKFVMRLRVKNTITIICDVFYERETWAKKKKAIFKDSLKNNNKIIYSCV